MSRHSYFWTNGQIEVLIRAYKEGKGLTEAERLLPEKSRTTIAAKACRLGITTPKPRKRKGPLPSDDDN